MKRYTEFTEWVTADREPRDNFKTLVSCVLPRPIAFVSTISENGAINLAPFSFFNAVGTNPPAVVFSPATKADGTSKDTIVNLRAIGEFVVSVVPYDIRIAMNESSKPFPPEVDEFEAAGFTPLPSRFIRPHGMQTASDRAGGRRTAIGQHLHRRNPLFPRGPCSSLARWNRGC